MSADPEEYLGTKFFDQLVGGHREWLSQFDRVYLDKWDRLFTKDNSEAALCEAATRQILEELDVTVEPCPLRGNERNPDFKCQKDGELFYVDATSVMKDTATRRSRLDDAPGKHGASHYGLLTEAFFQKVDKKVRQFQDVDAPSVVAIGTFHFQAGALCFDKKSAREILTGKSGIGGRINENTGEAVGRPYNVTSLESAPFLKMRRIICDAPPVQSTKKSISAILLCPFGVHPMKCLGILHPEPYHGFERSLLANVEFCRLKEGWQHGDLVVEWI
jgi:hypothetical protein